MPATAVPQPAVSGMAMEAVSAARRRQQAFGTPSPAERSMRLVASKASLRKRAAHEAARGLLIACLGRRVTDTGRNQVPYRRRTRERT